MCVITLLVHSTVFTNDCVSGDQSVRLIKFSDDATLIGCIENADATAYREEVQRMVDWCGKNNLVLNVSKTCEMTIDFRKHKNPMCQLLIDNTVVKQVESFKFIGSTISSDLSWGNNTALMVKKGQQLETVEEIRHLPNYPKTILSCYHRKRFDFLHHCVDWSRLLRGESPAGNTCEVRIQNNRAYIANH